ncbi:MAG: DAK2 domain-containing protein [Chloroflexi bacterium]|nr:DAK2 domain-containing protein [Chloroflexota bacterium]
MTADQLGSKEPTRFDGEQLRGMFAAAADLLERHVEAVNALNVFPVPDGDTGTNMFLTLRDMLRETGAAGGSTAGEVAAAVAKGALMGARGNSGVILSQFFKGFASELDGKPDFGAVEMAFSLERARKYSYRAVGEPVEGTLLTVITRVAEAARESVQAGDSLHGLLDAVCDASRRAVELTPTMLPILREAGVVDAGGLGLYIILEGVRMYAKGEDPGTKELVLPGPAGVIAAAAEPGSAMVSAEFLDATDEELYGYCTQFIVSGEGLDPEVLRERMASLASSIVVVGDQSIVKVHVHVDDPGPVLSAGVSLGGLSQIKIDNIDEQHREYASARRQTEVPPVAPVDDTGVAVVAVAVGEGIEGVFADLGAARVIAGGDTMNPSVQELVEAVEGVSAREVILLPNNPNIVSVADQASKVSTKEVRVVPATTIPQGIAAILAFNSESDVEENLSAMGSMLPSVRTGEVCRAVRTALINGVAVREGQTIGLLERELVAAGDDPSDVLLKLLREANVSEGDLVTLYWGQSLTPDGADEARQRVEASLPGVEVEVVPGGQPHYDYIVSIE